MTEPALRAAGNVTLRRWRPEDAAWYVGARDDAVLRWTREDPDLTVAEARAAIAAAEGAFAGFAIQEAGDLVGNLVIRREGDAVEVSYWIVAEARGRGIATAALLAGSEWAARLPGITELFLVTHPDNKASQRVAIAAGYRADGKAPAPHACATEDGLVDRFVRAVVA